MEMKSVTGNPSQIIIDQLAALGIKFVFNNSGSREAIFFDALHAHPEINGILALHEGSVAAMAGGYTQVNLDPAIMVVHLGAGLAQCLGQLINVWSGSLPVVVLTFAGDTGSYGDKVGLDLSHNVGPTSISLPFTKANWTVVEADGLSQAIYRAVQVAKTPPVGPVHLAVYDRLLKEDRITTKIMQGAIPNIRAGYPADADVETIIKALHDAERPLIYIGDGIWKSGAEAHVISVADHFGAWVAGHWGEMRRCPWVHPLYCGQFDGVLSALDPDLIMCIGLRANGRGKPQDFELFPNVKFLVSIGSDVGNLKNISGLDLAVLADEKRTLECLRDFSVSLQRCYLDRRMRAMEQAGKLRKKRRKAIQKDGPQSSQIRPWVLADALDKALESVGGGLVMVEQYAVPLESLKESDGHPRNVYIRAAGASEGYGIGGTIGLKLAAPDRPVVGLIGDGSMFYADSGLWTAVHHKIPVLFIISNNQSYGIVARAFGRIEGIMKNTGEYAGVVLDRTDPVKIANGFGIEGMHVEEESQLAGALIKGLGIVEEEGRPFLLNVKLPIGLPQGGRAAVPFSLR